MNPFRYIFKHTITSEEEEKSLSIGSVPINKGFGGKKTEMFFRENINNYLGKKEFFSKKRPFHQSRRIFKEISKILNVSDLIILIMDCRDPIGSWFDYFNSKKPDHKNKFLLVLNKCDLVPSWITKKWLKIFSKEFPVIAFHSNNKKPFGKKSLLSVIKQIKKSFFFKKKKISIGILGYPNVGKSSLINTLKGKKVSLSSSKAGETKVWKFIKLFKDIFLIDSPGLNLSPVLDSKKKILKGENFFYKKKENLKEILDLIQTIVDPSTMVSFSRLKKKPFYMLDSQKKEKKKFNLGKGGTLKEIEYKGKVLKEFILGKIPWYSPIPFAKNKKNKNFFWKIKKYLPSSDGRATDS